MDARKPVAAVIKEDLLIVVCDDGSVWTTSGVSADDSWQEAAPIPGSIAEAEDSN